MSALELVKATRLVVDALQSAPHILQIVTLNCELLCEGDFDKDIELLTSSLLWFAITMDSLKREDIMNFSSEVVTCVHAVAADWGETGVVTDYRKALEKRMKACKEYKKDKYLVLYTAHFCSVLMTYSSWPAFRFIVQDPKQIQTECEWMNDLHNRYLNGTNAVFDSLFLELIKKSFRFRIGDRYRIPFIPGPADESDDEVPELLPYGPGEVPSDDEVD